MRVLLVKYKIYSITFFTTYFITYTHLCVQYYIKYFMVRDYIQSFDIIFRSNIKGAHTMIAKGSLSSRCSCSQAFGLCYFSTLNHQIKIQ